MLMNTMTILNGKNMIVDFPNHYRSNRPFLCFYEGTTEWPTEENETEYHWRLRDEITGLSKRWLDVDTRMTKEIRNVPRQKNPTFEEFRKESAQIDAITHRYPRFPRLEEELDLLSFYLGYVHFGKQNVQINDPYIPVDISTMDLKSICTRTNCYYLKFPQPNSIAFFPGSYKLKHKLFNYSGNVFSDGAFVIVERRSNYLAIRVLLTFIDQSRIDQTFSIESDYSLPVFEFSVDFADSFVLNKAEFGFNELFTTKPEICSISHEEMHNVIKSTDPKHPNIFDPEEGILFTNMNTSITYILNFELTKRHSNE